MIEQTMEAPLPETTAPPEEIEALRWCEENRAVVEFVAPGEVQVRWCSVGFAQRRRAGTEGSGPALPIERFTGATFVEAVALARNCMGDA